MATLQEQRQAFEDPTLRIKVRQAIVKAAQAIIDEVGTTPNHAQRLAWAKNALPDPDALVNEFLGYVIAKNDGATLAQIIAATDATVQGNVNAAIDPLS